MAMYGADLGVDGSMNKLILAAEQTAVRLYEESVSNSYCMVLSLYRVVSYIVNRY